MQRLLDFLPLSFDTIDTIRARIDADANAGIDPTSDDFIDQTVGGWWYDLTQAPALEIERLRDFLGTEVVAAMFPAFAWGEYLDYHGVTLDVPRKDASAATGSVTFAGTNGTVINSGTVVAQPAADPDDDPIEFVTTAAGTIASGVATVAVQAAEAGAAGNVAAGTITSIVSPASGVTVSNAAPITGGSDVETDEDYRERLLLEYAQGQGAGTRSDYERWALAYPGIGSVTVEALWSGAGTVRVVVTDNNFDAVSSTVRTGLQAELDPPAATTATTGSHTLPVATINVVSTAAFRTSGFIQIDLGTSRQVVSYTGKTSTTFTGCAGGTGTVTAGSSVTQGGAGEGKAPIGAHVTVDTVTIVTAAIAGTVVHKPGYSLDGTAGTIATRTDITNSIKEYIDNLAPGDDVVLSRVSAQFHRVPGVLDVTGVTINGSAATLVVASLQKAKTGTVTLA